MPVLGSLQSVDWTGLTFCTNCTVCVYCYFEEALQPCIPAVILKRHVTHCRKSMVILTQNYSNLSCMFGISMSGTEQM